MFSHFAVQKTYNTMRLEMKNFKGVYIFNSVILILLRC